MSAAVEVITEVERAQALLHPARLRLLEELVEPSSAAAAARRLGLPRQRVNYHLRELESKGLIELVEERRTGSCVERRYQRTGVSYAISTAALGRLGSTPEQVADRFSSAYQIALASRVVTELGALQRGAATAGKELPTLTLETEVRFVSPAERSAFADELADQVARLVQKYHDARSPGGRAFRIYLGAYPRPAPPPDVSGTVGGEG